VVKIATFAKPETVKHFVFFHLKENVLVELKSIYNSIKKLASAATLQA
jgi:hypothetical protein